MVVANAEILLWERTAREGAVQERRYEGVLRLALIEGVESIGQWGGDSKRGNHEAESVAFMRIACPISSTAPSHEPELCWGGGLGGG